MRRAWLLLPIVVIPAAFWLLGNDASLFLIWWLILTLVGMIWWPLASRLLPAADYGWTLAKGMGLALSSGSAFLLHHVSPFPFARGWLIALLLLTAIIIWSMGIWYPRLKSKTKEPVINLSNNTWAHIGIIETVFGLALLFWLFTRGLKPELDSLEKFMNIGFMNSIWRSDGMPAADMWFSGGSINYYYFGHYASTWLARLANIKPLIAYQLAMASLPALSLVLAASFGLHMLQFRINKSAIDHSRSSTFPRTVILSALAAFSSGLILIFGGNQHAFLFSDKSPVRKFTSFLINKSIIPGSNEAAFWFANSTRYIGYNPDTTDKTIHEFPYYSYLVADLHAHVINLVFVLSLLLIILAYVKRGPVCRRNIRELIREPYYYLMAAFLAIFMMANFWDFIIYFALLCLIMWIFFSRSTGRSISIQGLSVFILQSALIMIIFLKVNAPLLALALYLAAAIINLLISTKAADGLSSAGSQMGWLFFLAHLFSLPFNLDFEPIAKEIALTVARSSLAQLWVLWGAHIAAGLIYLLWLFLKQSRPKLRKTFPPLPQQQLMAMESNSSISDRLYKAFRAAMSEPADRLLAAIFLMGLFLILLPEIVYVVDIYSGDYKRANTMFKFTYQAFVLLSLVWGCTAPLVLSSISSSVTRAQSSMLDRSPKRKRVDHRYIIALASAALLIIMIVIPLWYPLSATKQWLGPFSRDRYRGLDALEPLALKDSAIISGSSPGELAADVSAIKWLNDNIEGQPVVLESFGDSYTDYGRISAFTGLPTIIGWQTHEWLWRTSEENPDAFSSVVVPRQQAVRDIYTTDDQQLRLDLIKEYSVEYIVIGQLEREKFSTISEDDRTISLIREDLISKLGEKVFNQGYFSIYRIN